MTATSIVAPRSAEDLAVLLRERSGPVRLVGSGSRQLRLPAAHAALHVALTGLDAIERLDALDQFRVQRLGLVGGAERAVGHAAPGTSGELADFGGS